MLICFVLVASQVHSYRFDSLHHSTRLGVRTPRHVNQHDSRVHLVDLDVWLLLLLLNTGAVGEADELHVVHAPRHPRR